MTGQKKFQWNTENITQKKAGDIKLNFNLKI